MHVQSTFNVSAGCEVQFIRNENAFSAAPPRLRWIIGDPVNAALSRVDGTILLRGDFTLLMNVQWSDTSAFYLGNGFSAGATLRWYGQTGDVAVNVDARSTYVPGSLFFSGAGPNMVLRGTMAVSLLRRASLRACIQGVACHQRP